MMPKPTMSDDEPKPSETPEEKAAPSSEEIPLPWPAFVRGASENDIKKRLREEMQRIVEECSISTDDYCLISLYDTHERITSWDADRVYSALQKENPDHKKNVLLFVVSQGGRIEPAYQ